MKTLLTTGTTFTANMNGATANETSNSLTDKSVTSRRLLVAFMSLVMILFIASSCSRNSGSGCGTWPMANARNHKVYKDAKQPAYNYNKNSRQFASYKGFN